MKYLILSKDLLFEKLKNVNKKIDNLYLFGSSQSPDEKILDDIIKFKIRNYLIILGPYVKNSIIINLKKRNFKITINPENYYELLCASKNVICIYGVSTYEAIAIGLKPLIYIPKNETPQRLNDIKLLNIKKLSQNYNYQNLKKTKKLTKINSQVSFGGSNILRLI